MALYGQPPRWGCLGAMKILRYSCRGLSRNPTVRALLDVQRQQGTDIVILSKTNLDDWAAEVLRRCMKMDHKEVMRSDGRSGRLILL